MANFDRKTSDFGGLGSSRQNFGLFENLDIFAIFTDRVGRNLARASAFNRQKRVYQRRITPPDVFLAVPDGFLTF